MDDEADVKNMIALIKSNQEETAEDFQYDDFINFETSDVEENEETYFDKNYDFSNFTSTDISKLNSYNPQSILKPEERLLIDSCTDPELKNLLLLNRTKNFQLMQLYKKLKDLLIQCQEDIKEKREVISNFLKCNKDQPYSSGAWRLAAPYFKDKKLYTCPPNVDTLRKKRNNELTAYDISITIKWSKVECDKLLGAVKLNYNINQQNETLKKIRSLQEACSSQLLEMEQKMEQLQSEDNSEVPPLGSDQYIDWMRVAEVFLQDRRTALECQSFWHIYLHPSINKSPWTPEENVKLKALVKKYKFQNWDKIAGELGGNRTGFTACMNYYCNLHERFKKGDFTFEEDEKLLHLVRKHRMGNFIPWVKIVQYFKNRTRAQIHHRYTYFLTQNDKKKGKFTDAEDILLMILVDRFGRNFKKCSQYFPTRSIVQIKARYISNLQQKLKKGSFTAEDDEIIMNYAQENGTKSWSKLTKVLQRCSNQIRQRYNTISTFLGKNPNSTLAVVPRRKHNLKVEEESYSFLRTVADQFANSSNVPTLQQIQNALLNHQQEDNSEISETSPYTESFVAPLNIDDMLTNFFCNSFKINPTKSISSRHVNKAVKDVKTVLNILKVKLDIPENFDEDTRLDNLDVAILNVLTDNSTDQNDSDDEIQELLPPNLNTFVGLRGVLIKHQTDKLERRNVEDIYNECKQQFVTNIKLDITKHLVNLPDKLRMGVEKDRKLFYRRFHSLFKWPAIMTLENPTSELLSTCTGSLFTRKMEVKRTYSRADKFKAYEKQTQPPEPPASSSTKPAPLTLTPVTNKSIIEDLIRNKNKKLFSMEPVKCKGQTKVVIKEVNFHSAVDKQLNIFTSNRAVREKPVSSSTKRLKSDDKPSEKKRKLALSESQSECIVLNHQNDDSYISSDDEFVENTADDINDLDKLETFLEEQQRQDGLDEEVLDDDMEDLKKLESFLKDQEEQDVDLPENVFI